jgi:hypothetical protein
MNPRNESWTPIFCKTSQTGERGGNPVDEEILEEILDTHFSVWMRKSWEEILDTHISESWGITVNR